MSIRSKIHKVFLRFRPAPNAAGEQPHIKFPIGHLFERRELDLEALAREADTRFEKVYYGHTGRVMFKWAHYLKAYDQILAPYVGKPITLVEIGLAGGGSLQLWREYLGPQIRIVGIDREPGCKGFETEGVEIFIGDQGDAAFLRSVADEIGEVDVVVDDGSHINSHQILTFETLFPIVKNGGTYVCEDLHTSYWPDYGGGLGKKDTFIGYAKDLIDNLHSDWGVSELPADHISRHVGSMTITDSLVAFKKFKREQPFMAWVGESHQTSGSS